MGPSPNNPPQPEIPTQLTPSLGSDISGMQTDQMFRLIDSILPFEACLYYQFLPLALEGRHLKLGMVEPQDSSALDYVRHILAYLNCSLKTERISADTHQAMLSAYLNYTHKFPPPRKPVPKKDRQANRSEPSPAISEELAILESETGESSDNAPTATPLSPQTPLVPAQTPPLPNPVPLKQQQQKTEEDLPKPSAQELPPLEVQALHLSRPIEFLATLSPKQLLQELLGRVLIGGIGRLYFERQPNQGRILWSQDGVLQSVLEGVTLSVFQGVIIELKRIVNLPLLPVLQPKQLEIERRYQQETLLLRLRVMPGNHGEEATLQVLRGVALRFYQRQQVEKLGEEALKLAQQLQRKVNEIRDRSYRNPVPLEVLPALNQLVHGLEKQLESLADLPINQHPDESPMEGRE
jgi:type II secretory ATPase GspE/PulE/Tfp pilus assembly ATPase PilB-like protein